MLTYRHLGVWKEGDITVVRFGDHRILDEVAIDKIGEELYSVAGQEKCEKLLLNFAGVERLSTLMLGKLLMLNRKMQSKGGQLKLCDLDPQVRDVLASTRLDQILDICENEADARRSFAT